MTKQHENFVSAPDRSRKRRILYVVAVLALIFAVVLLLKTRRPPVQDEPARAITPALTVTSAASREILWPVELKASGSVAPWEEAIIGAQIGGYQLVQVFVNVGDVVRKGQVIAEFDADLLQAEHAQLKATADEATANRSRAMSLQRSRAMSDQDVLQFVTRSKTANAALAANELRLRYTEVRAPDDGVVSARSATLGAVVPVGQELFRIIRQGRLEWRGELTAEQLSHVRLGQEVVLSLPDGSSATATVRQTSPTLDNASRLGIIYADIKQGSSARAGMYAPGAIALGQSQALVVPAESVVIRDGRSYVFTPSDEGPTPHVSLRGVTLGRRNERAIEIIQGLRKAEHVVVQGAGFLKDRDVVRLANDTPERGGRP